MEGAHGLSDPAMVAWCAGPLIGPDGQLHLDAGTYYRAWDEELLRLRYAEEREEDEHELAHGGPTAVSALREERMAYQHQPAKAAMWRRWQAAIGDLRWHREMCRELDGPPWPAYAG